MDVAENRHGMSTLLIRTARDVKRYRNWKRLLGIIAGALAILVTLIYIAAALYTATGSFTVRVNKLDAANYSMVISDSRDFTQASTRLDARANEEVDNVCYTEVMNDLRAEDGAHNGENYLATTFYVRNDGRYILDYGYELYVSNVTRNLDKAIRVMVIINDTDVKTYAHWDDPTSVEYVCPFDESSMEVFGVTENFYSDNIVMQGRADHLAPYATSNDYVKFDIIIWIEGDDKDCVDALRGGTFRVDMTFSIINAYEEN